MKYTYEVKLAGNVIDLHKLLNDMGDKGFKLSKFTPFSDKDIHVGFIVIFEKEIKNQLLG